MSVKKSKHNAVSIGVAFKKVTRAKLDLIAAGLDRPVGWVIRFAVSAYLEDVVEMDEYCTRFPRLAAALKQAMAEAGGDEDEIFGLEQSTLSSSAFEHPSIQLVRPGIKVAAPAIELQSPAIQHVIPAISQPDEPAQTGDPRPASGLLAG